MFLLPACHVSAASSSSAYKTVFHVCWVFSFLFFFHLYLGRHIRHRDSSCRLSFISGSTYHPHSQAENTVSKIALRRAQGTAGTYLSVT